MNKRVKANPKEQKNREATQSLAARYVPQNRAAANKTRRKSLASETSSDTKKTGFETDTIQNKREQRAILNSCSIIYL